MGCPSNGYQARVSVDDNNCLIRNRDGEEQANASPTVFGYDIRDEFD